MKSKFLLFAVGLLLAGFSLPLFAASTPAADDGKWYYVKSQRTNSEGLFWTFQTGNYVQPKALAKTDAQKFTIVSIEGKGTVGIKAFNGKKINTSRPVDSYTSVLVENWTDAGATTGWTLTLNEVNGVQGCAFPGENSGLHQGGATWGYQVAAGWYNITDYCTFFFYEVREDIDLQLAIDAAIELKESVKVGTEVGQTPQAAIDTYQGAITTAKETLESTDETAIATAISTLATATTAFKEAKIPIVQSSTESAPVWYLIKNTVRGDSKGSTVFTTTPNGRLEGTTPANAIPADGSGTGNKATKLNHLFRFERQADLTYKIVNAAMPALEVLRTASGGNSSNEVKCGTPNGSTWNINLIGYNGTLEVNEVKFVGAQVNTDWHMAGHYAVVSYTGGTGTASAWYVEEYTGDVSALYQGQYNDLETQYKAIVDESGNPKAAYPLGTEPGTYNAAKFTAMKDAYTAMVAAGTSSPNIMNLLTAMTNTMADFKASKVQPVAYAGTITPGAKYTLKLVQDGAAKDGYYLANPRLDANNGTDGVRPQATLVENIDGATTVWEFVASNTAGQYIITSNRKEKEYIDEEGRVRDASTYEDSGWTTKVLMQNTLTYDEGTTLLIVKIVQNNNYFTVGAAENATLGRSASWSTFKVEPYISTAVDAHAASAVQVKAVNRMLVVTGSTEEVSAFTLTGAKVDTQKALLPGIYIVKVGAQSFKLNVR